jgi:aminoglycoside phosphotransferase family enzyme/predicted kinase
VSNGELPGHIRALLSPSAYPHDAVSPELRQTHISYLLFAGDYVYKLKKPVNFGFLDFSTLEKRRHYCEEEVRLNRRLCSDTYLGVVAVGLRDGSAVLEATDDIVDYAVKMRRLPDGGMMTPLLERGQIDQQAVGELARRIAAFHRDAEQNDEIDTVGGLATVKANWQENFEQTEPYIGRTITRSQLDDVRAFVENVVEGNPELFERRRLEGRIRDCHGDLRSDAVCFLPESGICIFDCIEFNERFRYSDVAADIAFLAMDLEFRGRHDLSDVLMTNYVAASQDGTLPMLMPFYKCYRAYVRGKVDGYQIDQPEIDRAQRREAGDVAARYFELAQRYATQLSPYTLFITVGVTGSGKSYIANALAARIGAALLSSDITRKRLVGVDTVERHWEPFEQGIYAPDVTERTYEALLTEAGEWLARGKPVVLDASFLKREHRERALRHAFEADAGFVAIECDVDDATVLERLSERSGETSTVSDGRWEIYQAQLTRREPIDELPTGTHLILEQDWPLEKQVDHVLAHVLKQQDNTGG